jgi:uncharacterized repeat protein (TIGR03803 family)
MKIGAIVFFAGMVGCAVLQPISAAMSATPAEKVLYSFCSRKGCADGTQPEVGVIYVNGALYGATMIGGTGHSEECNQFDGCGVLFKLDPGSGAEQVLHSFCSSKNCMDGDRPFGDLIYLGGLVYGTTYGGGVNGEYGTVYSLDPATDVHKVVYSFCSIALCLDGWGPMGSFIHSGNTLYGTTNGGGPGGQNRGTVYSFYRTNGAESALYSFCQELSCFDGEYPSAGLVAAGGVAYGTTYDGGVYNGGTVFSLNLKTGAETVLYSFCTQANCADGAHPQSGLIDINGYLYGMTSVGGDGVYCPNTSGCGTLFAVNASSGAESVLHAFCSQESCSDGSEGTAFTTGGLINVNGVLYGTTQYGGEGASGTVFSFDLKSRSETVVHAFGGPPDGNEPAAGLINVKGVLYGTTLFGGVHGGGSVFQLRL